MRTVKQIRRDAEDPAEKAKAKRDRDAGIVYHGGDAGEHAAIIIAQSVDRLTDKLDEVLLFLANAQGLALDGRVHGEDDEDPLA